MRSAVYHPYVPPDVLRVRDVERPSAGVGEFLLRLHAAGATKADCTSADVSVADRVADSAREFCERP